MEPRRIVRWRRGRDEPAVRLHSARRWHHSGKSSILDIIRPMLISGTAFLRLRTNR
ncbi:erythromycin resistance leader peptide [Corynebacterium guaraldiae]|nr:erythromycin resistance leader peptide [Corynebacterium guaraldiae]